MVALRLNWARCEWLGCGYLHCDSVAGKTIDVLTMPLFLASCNILGLRSESRKRIKSSFIVRIFSTNQGKKILPKTVLAFPMAS